jgi:hypothetical protein
MQIGKIAVCGLLLALVGCTKAKTTEVKAAPGGVGLQTQVLEPGAEPREQLRYKRVTGLTEDLVIEIGLASLLETTGASAAVASPVLALGLNIGSTSCAASGLCSYPISFRIIGVKMPEGATDADAEAITKQVEALADVKGTFEVDDRGITRRADVVVPPGLSTRLATLLGNIRTSLIAVPLPEEAIGIGGRWQVERLHEVGGIKTKQTVVYSLLEREGRVLRLGMTLQQTAAPQEIALEPGTAFQVEAYEVSGAGSLVMSLDAITPLSEIHANSELRGIVHHGAESAPLRVAGSGDVIVAPVSSNTGT